VRDPLAFLSSCISNDINVGFADRHFYSDWWNSCDWLEFSREWNIPVHHFFRRHVYSASRSYLSKPLATVLTFLISALAHELVMGCITKKLRGYGFFMMMMQIPIVTVQKTRFIRGRTLLNVSVLRDNYKTVSNEMYRTCSFGVR
jgi:sterol O-acyltransferase